MGPKSARRLILSTAAVGRGDAVESVILGVTSHKFVIRGSPATATVPINLSILNKQTGDPAQSLSAGECRAQGRRRRLQGRRETARGVFAQQA